MLWNCKYCSSEIFPKTTDFLPSRYLPVVMARAWISWRDDDFVGAEREFRSSAEFCSENPVWRLNAGHVLFMQGDKYKEAAAFYEPIVRQHGDDVKLFFIFKNLLKQLTNLKSISRL